MTIGYIGVGAMGGAIARRMLTQGLQVLVYDTSALAVDRMVERGAMRAGSIEEVVNSAEIVFACLPKPEVSREVALGPGGKCHHRLLHPRSRGHAKPLAIRHQ